MVELVEYLVKNIVKKQDAVSVKQYDDSDDVTIEVLVDDSDMGSLIGKGGKNASAIRTVAQMCAYNKGIKKVRINFDSYKI